MVVVEGFIGLINLLDFLIRMPVIIMAIREITIATGPERRRLQIRAPVAKTKPSILYFLAITG